MLLPPPKRLAFASRLIVKPMQSAKAILRKRCIRVFPFVECTRAILHR